MAQIGRGDRRVLLSKNRKPHRAKSPVQETGTTPRDC
jgi:hypothetical protein